MRDGPVTIDHLVPFQCSINVLVARLVSALQRPRDSSWSTRTATLPSWLYLRPVGVGLATTFQLVPFQCSTSVMSLA